jgi:hypothetical protein
MKSSDMRFTAHSKAPEGIKYISEIENLKIHTKSERVNHLSDFDLTFQLHNQRQKVRLDLHPNHNICSISGYAREFEESRRNQET